MRVVLITCYKDPDYIRSRSLRAALQEIPDLDLVVIKNKQHGVLKYPEVIWKTFVARLTKRPDVYILTFRGYELLPITRLITAGKTLWFDEFINPLEVVSEHRKQMTGLKKALTGIWLIMGRLYYWFLGRCQLVLLDTPAHADYSAQQSKLTRKKYVSIPVGTDESVFVPRPKHSADGHFKVFYYGNMVPLHGLQFVLDAALLLKNEKKIQFLIVGGNRYTHTQAYAAKDQGAQIEYRPWLAFDKLPTAIAQSDLCIGGPFGNTLQAQLVTTGKTYQFLASQVPVLIGETKNNQEATGFVDKQNCLIVPQGNAEAIAKAVQWAADHPKQLHDIGARGRGLYEARYSTKVISQQLSDLLIHTQA